MRLGVISQWVLFRKAFCTLLAGAGIFSSVMELATVLDPVDISDRSETLILLVHTTECSSAVQALVQLRNRLPQARPVLLVDNPDDEFCARALEAGAWGCLSTTDSPQVLLKALRKVGEGERWFSHRVTNKVIDKLIAFDRPESNLAATLSPREWEVLALVAKGHSDKEVANLLFISKETAHSHVKSIYKKLQVRTRRSAAVYYFKNARAETEPSAVPFTATTVFDIA